MSEPPPPNPPMNLPPVPPPDVPPATPPPLPPASTIDYRTPGLQQPQAQNPGLDNYQRVADTVGMVPNVRLKDNLYQLIAGAIGGVIGAIIGVALGGSAGLVIGGLAGFVVVALFWGIGLGIVGAIRGLKKR